MKLVCSRCGAPLKDMFIILRSSVTLVKISSNGSFVPAENAAEPTSEHLCMSCFEKYANCLNSLNEEYEGVYAVNMVDVVDDVQYE